MGTSEAGGGDEVKPLFQDLSAEDEENNVTELESLCFNCHEQGTTRLMLTRIPFFKEVIISSFSCDECGYDNREVQFGGRIQEKGAKLTVTVKTEQDLNRQVVKSDWATFALPSIEFEQPMTSKGEINTIEGLIDAVQNGLEAAQPLRKIEAPEVAAKIDQFIEKLVKLKTLEKPFELVIDDPSGNSFIENPLAPAKDEALRLEHYPRTKEQEIAMGIRGEEEEEDEKQEETEPETAEEGGKFKVKEEVMTFKDNCPNCNTPCETNMKLVDIPYFKEALIMATTCDACGLRENEVKGGAGFEEKGTLITLKLTDPSDLSRDVLKSDTCGMCIPEIELELEEGTLGGKFTTIEGLLTNVKDQLNTSNPFIVGDSAQDDSKSKLQQFLVKLDKIIQGEMLDIHFILNDPAGNSYIQNVYAPDEDPELKTEKYVRTHEQNESLGINDMKTENYQES